MSKVETQQGSCRADGTGVTSPSCTEQPGPLLDLLSLRYTGWAGPCSPGETAGEPRYLAWQLPLGPGSILHPPPYCLLQRADLCRPHQLGFWALQLPSGVAYREPRQEHQGSGESGLGWLPPSTDGPATIKMSLALGSPLPETMLSSPP